MNELLDLLCNKVGKWHHKKYLADCLGVTPTLAHRWINRGYLPVERAIECEYIFGIDRKNMIDPRLLCDITGCVGL